MSKAWLGVALVMSCFSSMALAKGERTFVDQVQKIRTKALVSDITFKKAASIYVVSDPKLLKKLQQSHKNKKAVEVTAEIKTLKIINIKGP